ncbi:hypothetical protein [Niveispirillum sp.]|uniref:DODA-type extradiol aromatic ring-opening family dioxygenase n=1 Tax=Niveispirillum sp. TaxID=1917217 RepID=UPI001B52FFB9|nr:hypothetical protein [Niveispirillum sp.]MBP7336521.1 hypothetical protein [Niveispirillum sp.]
MPIIMGAGVGYSPLLYRPRAQWEAVFRFLRKDAIQPKRSGTEDASVLDGYEARISQGFSALRQAIAGAGLDALILITADRGSQFDSSHVPQIHVQVGGEVWGDPAIAALGEAPQRHVFACEETVGDILAEELVRDGFDIAEARRAFKPVGHPGQGATPALIEAATRLAGELPIVPISINCHVAPVMTGVRIHRLGQALARAATLTDKRLGLLVSGGLSGDPQGDMAGWVDDVFDKWVLARLQRGRSADLVRVWDVPSRNLLAGTTEVRLWTAAAAALDQAGCPARVHDYMPIHHAAAGVAFVTWEN